jgi:hypothetical protein
MPIQKIKSGRVITVPVDKFIGSKGEIFFDEDVGQLRLGDGFTPGGHILNYGGGGGSYSLPPATTSTLGGIKVGSNLTITSDGTLNANPSVSNSFQTIHVDGQNDLVANGADTLQIVAGTGILIETNSNYSPVQSVTISSYGIPNLDGGGPSDVYDFTVIADGGGP